MRHTFERRTLFCAAILLSSWIWGAASAELISYWDFDGDSVADMWAGNDAALNGSCLFTAGRPGAGRAVALSGDDHMEMAAKDFDDLATFSVALWIQVHAFSRESQTVISKARSWALLRNVAADSLAFACQGLSEEGRGARATIAAAGSKTVNDGQWHHVVGTYDGKRVALYVDGVLDGSSPASGQDVKAISPIWVGADSLLTGREFEGRVDDIAIFGHALDAAGVEKLHAQGIASFVPRTYMTDLVASVENAVGTQAAAEAVATVEKKIAEYQDWRLAHWRDVGFRDAYLSPDVYHLLARAKEQAGAPASDILAAYESSVFYVPYPTKYVAATISWFSEHATQDQYAQAVRSLSRNSRVLSCDVRKITERLAATGRWEALQRFLDVLFASVDVTGMPTHSYAGAVAAALEGNDAWLQRFTDYCQTHEGFAVHLFADEDERAKGHLKQKDHRSAAKIYEDVAAKCRNIHDKAIFDFRRCECLFSGQEFRPAIAELDKFIAAYRSCDSLLVSRAIMLKGRCHISLGQMDQATEALLRLVIDYPETESAVEANFFLGYYYMLQGQYPSALEAFRLVVAEYPDNPYAQKSRTYIARIQGLTKGAKTQ